jgi:hypothetical protein
MKHPALPPYGRSPSAGAACSASTASNSTDGYQVHTGDQPIYLPTWGTPDSCTIRVHIMRLHKKIDTGHNKACRIRAVPGLGYIFDPDTVEPAHDPKRR